MKNKEAEVAQLLLENTEWYESLQDNLMPCTSVNHVAKKIVKLFSSKKEAINFNLEYKLQQFREVQGEYYNDADNDKRYNNKIGNENAELMLQLINELEGELRKAETNIRLLSVPGKRYDKDDMRAVAEYYDSNYENFDSWLEGYDWPL